MWRDSLDGESSNHTTTIYMQQHITQNLNISATKGLKHTVPLCEESKFQGPSFLINNDRRRVVSVRTQSVCKIYITDSKTRKIARTNFRIGIINNCLEATDYTDVPRNSEPTY
jgi:hypothetical protein